MLNRFIYIFFPVQLSVVRVKGAIVSVTLVSFIMV